MKISQKEHSSIIQQKVDNAFTLYRGGVTNIDILIEMTGLSSFQLRSNFNKAGLKFTKNI